MGGTCISRRYHQTRRLFCCIKVFENDREYQHKDIDADFLEKNLVISSLMQSWLANPCSKLWLETEDSRLNGLTFASWLKDMDSFGDDDCCYHCPGCNGQNGEVVGYDHVRILTEENRGVSNFTNVVFIFFFAGNIYKLYLLATSQCVVLALVAHSMGRWLRDGACISRRYNQTRRIYCCTQKLETRWNIKLMPLILQFLEKDMAILIWFWHEMMQSWLTNSYIKLWFDIFFCRLIWRIFVSLLGDADWWHNCSGSSGDNGGFMGCHHARLLIEENRGVPNISNEVFFFAGAVHMRHLLISSQCVVLALVAQSIERGLMDEACVPWTFKQTRTIE